MNTKEQLPLVTYEQSKKLDESGFDWKTSHSYFFRPSSTGYKKPAWVLDMGYKIKRESSLPAPTVALALKWIRDVKGFDSGIAQQKLKRFAYWFKKPGQDNFEMWNNYATYEQAESALLDALLTILETDK
jgi:hypothetical protein